MPHIEKKIYSGNYLEIIRYGQLVKKPKGGGPPKNSITPEAQRKINDKNARKNLQRLINTNFKKGDLFITLTYETPVSRQQGEKDLINFFRRVRGFREKNGLEKLKYIAVTELGKEERIHHHVIINDMGLSDVEKLWGKGFVDFRRLNPDGNYAGLAKYLLKEQGEKKEKNKRRWRQSKSIKPPITKTKVYKRNLTPYSKIKPDKGYKIIDVEIKDNIFTGIYQYAECIKLE